MCLGVPGLIDAIEGEGLTATGQVNFSGVVRDVALAYVPEARVGDYVIVHVGVAISILNEQEAERVLAAYKELEGDPNEVYE